MPGSPLAGLRTLILVVRGWQMQGERREFEHRLWYEAPSRVRCETSLDAYRHLVVSDGRRRWWSYDPSEMRVAQEGPEYQSAAEVACGFVDPAPVLADLVVESVEDTTVLGRPARRVRATGSGEELDGGNRVALVIDHASGLVLQRDVWAGDVQSIHAEVVDLQIDRSIPERVFTYMPESGVRLVDHDELEREFDALPRRLEESAPLMPFEVYVLPGSAWWTLEEAKPSLPRDEIRLGKHLMIVYSRFGMDDLHLWEWRLEESERPRDKPQIERGVGPFVVMTIGERERKPASVLVTTGGTRVQLQTFAVDEEELVRLARSLVPFPSGASGRTRSPL
jgi:outer membrane lipoprotein-sorting protein